MIAYVKVTQKSNHVLNTTNVTYYGKNLHLDSYLFVENEILENYQLQRRKEGICQFTMHFLGTWPIRGIVISHSGAQWLQRLCALRQASGCSMADRCH